MSKTGEGECEGEGDSESQPAERSGGQSKCGESWTVSLPRSLVGRSNCSRRRQNRAGASPVTA